MAYNVFCNVGVTTNVVKTDGAGNVAGTFAATVTDSTTLGGPLTATGSNINNSDLSVIIMGDHNCINTFASVNGTYELIGNGCCNVVYGCHNAIVNGALNYTGGCYHFIGDGCKNNSAGNFSAVVNGLCNNLSGDHSFIGNGRINNLAGNYSFIGGGELNGIGASCSTLGGGKHNTTVGDFTVITGGVDNVIGQSGTASFIGGGDTNKINSNSTAPPCATIVGGHNNTIGYLTGNIASEYSFIGGGNTNTICGVASVITGGDTNRACADNIFIGGGTNHIIAPSSGGPIVASGIASGDTNLVENSCSFIGGGTNNRVCANFSFIGGGSVHTICGDSSFIGGGFTNLVCADSNVVVGGDLNCAYLPCSFIGGGLKNQSCGNATVIAGGECNGIAGNWTVIGGGQCNDAGEYWGTISGGCRNIIAGPLASVPCTSIFAVIGGGGCNLICDSSTYAGIFSGQENMVSGRCSVIAGGYRNSIASIGHGYCLADLSFIGGGGGNNIDGAPNFSCYNVIGGGETNFISAPVFHSSILGGEENKVCSHRAAVAGGDHNVVQLDNSFIGAGSLNCIFPIPLAGAGGSFIGAGAGNCILTPPFGSYAGNSAIVAGVNNWICGAQSFIGATAPGKIEGNNGFLGAGGQNYICNGNLHSILNGGQNCIEDLSGRLNYQNTIINGNNNYILNAVAQPLGQNDNLIGAGTLNIICNSRCGFIGTGNNHLIHSEYSFIGSGFANNVCGNESAIIAGDNNTIYADRSFIGGGFGHRICSGADRSFIGGGDENNICTNSNFSLIGGGEKNNIHANSTHSFIGGGEKNSVTDNWNVLAGGCNNSMNYCFSSILGGLNNCISLSGSAPVGTDSIMSGNSNTICGHSVYSGIGNGEQNVLKNTDTSFIVTGCQNYICSPGITSTPVLHSFIGAGVQHRIFESCASIVSGETNTINNGAVHSFIGGGINNAVTGACSAILGGSGNNDGGFNNVFIAGSGITAPVPNTFFVNCLNACNTPGPGAPAGATTGTIFFDFVPSLPAPYNLCKILMIC